MNNNHSLFRQCMSRFATGVTIVSLYDDLHQPAGVTINSFSSLSLEPLLVSFSVKRSSHFYSKIANSKYFAINILTRQQENLSKKFTSANPENWHELPLLDYEQVKCPIIADSLAYLECKLYQRFDAGDHTIFVGEAIHMGELNQAEPLIYYARQYRSLNNDL